MIRRALTRSRTTQAAATAEVDSLTSASATVIIPIHIEEENEALLSANHPTEITKKSSVCIDIES